MRRRHHERRVDVTRDYGARDWPSVGHPRGNAHAGHAIGRIERDQRSRGCEREAKKPRSFARPLSSDGEYARARCGVEPEGDRASSAIHDSLGSAAHVGKRGSAIARRGMHEQHGARDGPIERIDRRFDREPGRPLRSHAPAIHALCRRMSGEDAEANDLVQDVFVRAWERLPSFRGQSSLATWLHRLAVNVVLEKWRSNKREALRMIDDADGLALDARPAQHDPDVLMDVETAVTRLPAGARTVFVLHDIEGYSHDEIASMTGIAAGTSRTQLFRARRALARVLDL